MQKPEEEDTVSRMEEKIKGEAGRQRGRRAQGWKETSGADGCSIAGGAVEEALICNLLMRDRICGQSRV